MKKYEVVLTGVSQDLVALALYHAGFSVYKTDDNDVAFSASDEQVQEVK